jgi:hypothetical protein
MQLKFIDMDIDKLILNIPQFKQVVKNTKEDYTAMLMCEIRTVGLRDKIERRFDTIEKIEKILDEHTDMP